MTARSSTTTASRATELWQGYELEPVERLQGLDGATFRERVQGRRPVVVPGGARESPMVERWDLPYLVEAAGDARVSVSAYSEDRRDFGSIEHRHMSLAQFVSELVRPERDEVLYLFNNRTCVFVRNESLAPAEESNPELTPLAADFRLPSFLAPDDFVLATMILGSRENATDLHYDNGGEAKALIQVRGRKRVILFPPDAAAALRPHTLFPRPDAPPAHSGSRARLDIHAPAEASPTTDVPGGWVAELEPGDVIYWPPFWFHDVENLDDVTLAAGVFVNEVRLHPLMLRHLSRLVFEELLSRAESRAGGGARGGWDVDMAIRERRVASLAELFQELEQTLLATDGEPEPGLREWNARLRRRG